MRITVVAVVVLIGGAAEAASVPLPRPRPAVTERAVPIPLVRPLPSGSFQPFAPSPPRPSACRASLKAVAQFAPEAPIDGAGDCGIADPVRLEAVILPDRARVAVNPPAVLRCAMAAALAQWVRQDMAPAAARLGSPLSGVENFDSYSCRGRNRVPDAKMSEHGRGNALDIRGMKLESGIVAHLTDPHVAKAVRNALRKSACARFATVLGPGSDGYHENHVHVDLAERRGGYRLCQWDVRQPLDRVLPSPHIASSRRPTPLESVTEPDPVPLPPARRAAGRQE